MDDKKIQRGIAFEDVNDLSRMPECASSRSACVSQTDYAQEGRLKHNGERLKSEVTLVSSSHMTVGNALSKDTHFILHGDTACR